MEGQTCFGLDKLVLNNNYADTTNMKEALIYDMYQYLGVDASLYNYAKISVNAEYWGVYLALEAVEDSFLLRNYGVKSGELYKPDSMDIGGVIGSGDRSKIPEDFDSSQFDGEMTEGFDASRFGGMKPPTGDSSESTGKSGSDSDTSPRTEGRPDMGNFDISDISGGFSMGSGGANLNYTDDNLDSYSTIWDSQVTSTSKSDHKRVVEALKNISEGTKLEKYMDVDNLLKYMAIHVFSVNEDSLSGMMAHNYYLYEYNGQLNILPWDYNLALGGMGSNNDATSTINDAIDNAFSGTNFFDTLMENEEYKAQYHAYLQQLVDEYIHGGGFDEFYTRTRSQIDSLVETDPTAFYTYDEYTEAVETFCEVVQLRGKSINGQLDGSIPSTGSEQRNSDALVDASHLDLSVMGSMDMVGGETNNVAGTASADTRASVTLFPVTNSSDKSGSENAQPDGTMPEGFDPSQFGGELPEGFDGELPEGFDPSQFDGQTPGSPDVSSDGNNDVDDGTASTDEGKKIDGTNLSAMGFGRYRSSSTSLIKNLITYSICFAVLIAALLIAKLYHRKPKRK